MKNKNKNKNKNKRKLNQLNNDHNDDIEIVSNDDNKKMKLMNNIMNNNNNNNNNNDSESDNDSDSDSSDGFINIGKKLTNKDIKMIEYNEGLYNSDDDDEEEEDNNKNDDNSDDSDSDSDNEVIINATFSFNDPKEIYFDAIEKLLINHQFISYQDFNYIDLCDIIINQMAVGTMITNEDDDLFGFATCLNFKIYENNISIRQIKEWLINKTPNLSLKNKITNLLNNNKTGIYIHEHMINLPLQLLPELHNNILLDKKWASKQKESFLGVNPIVFQFEHIIIISRCDIMDNNNNNNNNNNKKKNKENNNNEIDIKKLIYNKFDDEIFSTFANDLYSFYDEKNNNKTYWVIQHLTLKQFEQGINSIRNMINSNI